MSSSEMKAYWETNVVGQFSPYKKYADDLNKSVIFPDIIDRFVNSDDDSFEIDSLEGDIALRLRKARCFMFIKVTHYKRMVIAVILLKLTGWDSASRTSSGRDRNRS